MAEHEEEHLHQCLEKNIYPVCQQPITKFFAAANSRTAYFFLELLNRLEPGIVDPTASIQGTEE